MRTDKFVKTSISLAPQIMEKVDNYAADLGINRSAALSMLIKQAFDYQEQVKTIADFTNKIPALVEEMKKVQGEIKKNAIMRILQNSHYMRL